jgi:glutathione S-transferase
VQRLHFFFSILVLKVKTMKLYYSPGTCSMAVHIAAREAGVSLDLVKVDLMARKLPDGSDYLSINPRGYVPTLQLDDGTRLTEAAVLLQYIADLKPATGLLPAAGSMARVQVQRWLTFIGTEMHKTFGPLWHKETPDATKEAATTKLALHFAELNTLLAKQPYLTGDTFTVADAYAFAVVGWSRLVGISLTAYPSLLGFLDRVGKRPAVFQAMQAEGLIKAAA